LEGEHGAELFSSPAALARWLSARELIAAAARVGPSELRGALAAREGLRALAASNTRRARAGEALDRVNDAARGALVELRFTATGPRFVVPEAAGVNGALGVVLAITARAMLDGSWSRLKVCPGKDCGWAFYDHSRNQTGRWCSMSVCGGRAKARAHYRRRRAGSR
jgi:predicted RNA-binding Zn ribbon-like protein